MQRTEDPNAQVGLLVAMGLFWRDAEQPALALDEFEDALTYADNMGLTAVAETIHRAIERAREA
jgi:hypothetical protein